MNVDMDATLRTICLFTLLPALGFSVCGPFATGLNTRHALCTATRNAITIQAVYYCVYTTIMLANTLVMRPDTAIWPTPAGKSDMLTNQQSLNKLGKIKLLAGNLASGAFSTHLILFLHDRVNLVNSISCRVTEEAEFTRPNFQILAYVRQGALGWWFFFTMLQNENARKFALQNSHVSKSEGNFGRKIQKQWFTVCILYFTLTLWLTYYASKIFNETGASMIRIAVDVTNVVALIFIQYYKRIYSSDRHATILTSGTSDSFVLYPEKTAPSVKRTSNVIEPR